MIRSVWLIFAAAFFLVSFAQGVVSATEGEVSAARGGEPTYHRDVEALIQKHCQDCHRPGQVAPFSLLTYEQARKRGSDIAEIVERRAMPPWPISTTVGGPFRDARVLAENEIETIQKWVEADCPEGDAKDAPAPRDFASTWTLGEPDLILTPSVPFELGAEGNDEFLVFVVPSGLVEGKWITAIDYRPGNPKIVHHILGAFDISGAARKKDDAEPGPGFRSFGGFGVLPAGTLGGWAPGKIAHVMPEGVGKYIPAGADILLQIHYHKNGKKEKDASSIGLYFSKKPIDKLLRGALVPTGLEIRNELRHKFRIPKNDAHHEFRANWTATYDAHLIGLTPHMHWLGKDFTLVATKPDGSKRTLIQVDRWNFNWQGSYEFIEPVAIPRGTTFDLVAHFDNSADNPANPHSPPVDVTWGEQTTDEMCIGFLQLTSDAERLGDKPPPMLQGLLMRARNRNR